MKWQQDVHTFPMKNFPIDAMQEGRIEKLVQVFPITFTQQDRIKWPLAIIPWTNSSSHHPLGTTY